jgi:hypothetical protein
MVRLVGGDGNLDLDSGLDRHRGNLLDNLGGRLEVDEALVNLHLQVVPGLGSLSARSLAGGDGELLGRKADGALDAQVLVLGALNEVLAD